MTTWLVNGGGILLVALIIWWFWLAPKGRAKKPRRAGEDDR